MSVLQKLSIRSKVIIGFSILLAAFILFTFFSIYSLNSMGDLTTKLYNHPLNVSNASLRASMGVIKMHRSMKDVILAKNQFEKQLAIHAVEVEEQKVIENLNIVKEKILGSDGHLLEEEARKLFLDWKPIRDEVISLLIAGKRDKAAGITKEKGAAHVRKVENKMLELTSHARNKSNGFIKAAEKAQDRSITIEVGVIVFLIVLMVIINSIILKSILQPILALKKTMSTISETGKLAQAYIPGENEISEYFFFYNI